MTAAKTKTTAKTAAGKKNAPLAGKPLVDAIVQTLEEKLAGQVAVIDLRGVSGAADWFIVCEGGNTSHTTAIANGVIAGLKDKHATRPWLHEGLEEGRWALIDYTDVVVHVMLPDVRRFYDLESLWRRE